MNELLEVKRFHCRAAFATQLFNEKSFLKYDDEKGGGVKPGFKDALGVVLVV